MDEPHADREARLREELSDNTLTETRQDRLQRTQPMTTAWASRSGRSGCPLCHGRGIASETAAGPARGVKDWFLQTK